MTDEKAIKQVAEYFSSIANIVNWKDRVTPMRIVKNGPATIVFWQDGTKTIVKRAADEPESDYNAFTAALGRKVYGSNSALKRIVERTETQKQKMKNDNPIL